MDPLLPSLSIVLPCRNEAPNVERAIREAMEAARAVAERFEVVVVDDGSRDGTFDVARTVQQSAAEVRLVRNDRGRGYGGALKRGFREARMEWVFYTDADGQFEMAQIADLVPALERHDLVTGYRAPRRDPALRLLSGRAWTALTNALLGASVRDVNCAFKLLPRSLIDRVALVSDGAAFSAELLSKARRLGYRIGEVPVRHRPRRAGRQSGASPRVVLGAVRELARLWVEIPSRDSRAPTPASLP
jgi:glycosyltransferase involved in cell wall biosynthesis